MLRPRMRLRPMELVLSQNRVLPTGLSNHLGRSGHGGVGGLDGNSLYSQSVTLACILVAKMSSRVRKIVLRPRMRLRPMESVRRGMMWHQMLLLPKERVAHYLTAGLLDGRCSDGDLGGVGGNSSPNQPVK